MLILKLIIHPVHTWQTFPLGLSTTYVPSWLSLTLPISSFPSPFASTTNARANAIHPTPPPHHAFHPLFPLHTPVPEGITPISTDTGSHSDHRTPSSPSARLGQLYQVLTFFMATITSISASKSSPIESLWWRLGKKCDTNQMHRCCTDNIASIQMELSQFGQNENISIALVHKATIDRKS